MYDKPGMNNEKTNFIEEELIKKSSLGFLCYKKVILLKIKYLNTHL